MKAEEIIIFGAYIHVLVNVQHVLLTRALIAAQILVLTFHVVT